MKVASDSDLDVHRVLVLDMQPIDPPVGGGRLRLLGLYHGLGRKLPTTYVGTYDWPGERFRKHRLSECLAEIDIPLSKEHFAACSKWQSRVGGKTIIDATFHQLAYLSRDFVEYARSEVRKCDIIVFSHPWVYPIVKDLLRNGEQLIVYDSQNMEGVLRAGQLDDGAFGTEIVREVAKVEYDLCHQADLILACSHDDGELFHRIYEIPFRKIRVVPNGVFVSQIPAVGEDEKARIKGKLRLDGRPLAIFLGSLYPPNVEAANFICRKLAPALPEVTFAICGGVGQGLGKSPATQESSNVRLTGFIEEREKLFYLGAADLAVNPMFSGSGTNVKMFEFMAAGLAILTTPVGARGIEGGEDLAFRICTGEDFVEETRKMAKDPRSRRALGNSARAFVERKYSWEQISPCLGRLVRRWYSHMGKHRPFFSVIVPARGREKTSANLILSLAKQTWQDFELILVDSGSRGEKYQREGSALNVMRCCGDRDDIAGSRNLGAFYARGEVLAFTHDEYEPATNWLAKVRTYFDSDEVAGILESDGLVRPPVLKTDHVSRASLGNIGFDAGTLFVRHEVFRSVNGFEEGAERKSSQQAGS
jgi:glycosyltransferase involved in cell wall biosynthesis